MKRAFFLALISLLVFSAACFAEKESKKEEKAGPPPTIIPIQSAAGKFQTYTPGDEKKSRSQISIVTGGGEAVTFMATTGLVVYDAEGRMVPLGNVKKGDKVIVEYMNVDKLGKQAQSVKLTE